MPEEDIKPALPTWRLAVATLVLVVMAALVGNQAGQDAGTKKLQEAFEAGFKVGQICHAQPELDACRPSAMRYSGVL